MLLRLLRIPVGLMLFATIALFALADAPVAAQVILPPYPPPVMPPFLPPAPPRNFVVVAEHSVDALIDGPVATVKVTQVFRNDGPAQAEGVYVFPLPKNAAVADFQMTIDGETVEGKLMSAAEARAIYERIVRDLRDPALLEYVGQGLFQASVFPIPPGETRTVEFTYAQTLDLADGLYRFNYPLATERYSAWPVEQVAVYVELVNQPGLRTLYSPNYPLQIERSAEDAATVSYVASGVQPEGDFDLYFGVDEQAVGLNLLSYKPAGEDGYFVLLMAPTVEVEEDAIVARDLVVVADVSGSMQGTKMEQAREALHYIVDNLNPDDHFNLIAFSTGTRLWKSELQPVNEKSQTAASQWIDNLQATGSTDINRALLEALAQLDAGDGDRPAYVIFLTDGQPTQGETVAERIVDNAQANAPAERNVRLFTFGIGYDVNTDLLGTLSETLGGRDSYVRPDARVDEAVSSFYAQISTPVLADVDVAFDGAATVSELYPGPLPDLFAGEQLVVVGRYDEGGPVEVTLSGKVNGAERLYVYPDQLLADAGGEPFVARLWATRKLGVLMDEVRRSGSNDELIDAIIDLSLRYGIVTPYTSYLVQEPGMLLDVAGAGGELPTAAPIPLDQRALRYSVEAAAGAEAAAPAAGATAVEQRLQRQALSEATVAQQEDTLRYVAGHTFRLQGTTTDANGAPVELWVDVNFTDDMVVTEVIFGSDEYFDLLETSPEMAAWLSLSPTVVVVTGADEAVRVVLEEGVEGR